MEEKIFFREMLNEIKILADKKGNRITKGEIKDFFKDTHLQEEHYTLIYEYLAGQKIEIEDYRQLEKTAKPEIKSMGNAEEEAPVAMYLEDLHRVMPVTEQEEFLMFEKAAEGDELAKANLTEQYLLKVYELSRDYCNGKILQSDIIQEGNIGLMLAVNALTRKQSLNEYRNYLQQEIKDAMTSMVEEQEAMCDLDEEMVVRINHLNEAVHNLERDLEHKVSVDELSVYLEMSVDEIKDILRMAGDEIEVEGELCREPDSYTCESQED